MDTEYKTRHINLVHLKLREHACPYCPGVAYQTKSDLTKHVNLVHLKMREHARPYLRPRPFTPLRGFGITERTKVARPTCTVDPGIINAVTPSRMPYTMPSSKKFA